MSAFPQREPDPRLAAHMHAMKYEYKMMIKILLSTGLVRKKQLIMVNQLLNPMLMLIQHPCNAA